MNKWGLRSASMTLHQQKSPIKKALRLSLYSTIVIALIATSSCLSEDTSEDIVNTTDNQAAIELQKKRDLAEIEDNINNSYARLAAQRTDICPKLLQKDIDNNVIERVQEVMVDDYCDYYLYPQVDQHIAVSVNDDKIEALLIVPTLHNFADGDYKVDSYDKHVIRLAYNGASYKPERFSYDVKIEMIE